MDRTFDVYATHGSRTGANCATMDDLVHRTKDLRMQIEEDQNTINNLLAIILGNVELLRADLASGNLLEISLEQIAVATYRLHTQIGQILTRIASAYPE